MSNDEEKVVQITTITLRGSDYPVEVKVYKPRSGPPRATFRVPGLTAGRYGHEVTADTLEDLYALAMKATRARKVRIAIPVQMIHYPGKRRALRNGTIVGRHQGSRNILVRWEGQTEDVQADHFYDEERFLRPLSEEDAAEYLRLLDEKARVGRAIDKIEERYQIEDVSAVVEAEIERVAAETTE